MIPPLGGRASESMKRYPDLLLGNSDSTDLLIKRYAFSGKATFTQICCTLL
jgi:hypothetical protein